MPIERFSIPCSEDAVADLRERLSRTRWVNEGWDTASPFGVELPILKEICGYWKDGFDWKRQVERLSAFGHFQYRSAAGTIHFLHLKGVGPAPMPLILTHGWPGSFVEMLGILPRLADPAAFGGDPRDAFDVVVPSLPGFGYSSRPLEPGMNAFRVAELWVELMSELGYGRFAAQGGDLGASVTTALGLRHAERIIGIHLNFIPGSYRPFLEKDAELTEAEQGFLRDAAAWSEENGAYAHMQRTRPLTASVGLNDSPAGLAAWILEKFRDWSDCGGDIYSRFSRDELLTNLTIYWMTESIGSSFRMYVEGKRVPMAFGPEDFVSVPTAVAHFPRELFFPPQSWVERGYDVRRWTSMVRGGHFAAAEEPELLAEDLRTFFRELR